MPLYTIQINICCIGFARRTRRMAWSVLPYVYAFAFAFALSKVRGEMHSNPNSAGICNFCNHSTTPGKQQLIAKRTMDCYCCV